MYVFTVVSRAPKRGVGGSNPLGDGLQSVRKYNIIVWDAPAHASSWPFRFDFDLFDKAKWLNGILEKEEIIKPIIIGQSM